MKQKIRKIIRNILVVTLVILIGLYIVNPEQTFRLSPKKHDLVNLEKIETEHIIMYGGDAKFAEQLYKDLQIMFGAFYVNKRVKIYVAKPRWGNGIGFRKGVMYAGIYRRGLLGFSNVIIYNGSTSTLTHELVHFFTLNMKKEHVSEFTAQIVPKYRELTDRYKVVLVYNEVLAKRYKTVHEKNSKITRRNRMLTQAINEKVRLLHGKQNIKKTTKKVRKETVQA